jgi:hypothetical protein
MRQRPIAGAEAAAEVVDVVAVVAVAARAGLFR